jgi:D-arabinose 1-dehydrogenase-like Zn-dependent alcohol dehydrogenase
LGVVVAVGQGVEQPLVKQRVAVFGGVRCGACEPCRKGHDASCSRPLMLGVHCWGGYAEYLRIAARNCVPIPDGLSFAEATLIARHFPLAFGEVRLADLKAREWVVVMGAAGGLGSCLVQVAKTVAAHGGGLVTLDIKRLYQRHLHVMSGLGAERLEELERALQLGVSGEFRVLIDQVMPLREAAAAHRHVAQNASVGKIVLDPTLE